MKISIYIIFVYFNKINNDQRNRNNINKNNNNRKLKKINNNFLMVNTNLKTEIERFK